MKLQLIIAAFAMQYSKQMVRSPANINLQKFHSKPTSFNLGMMKEAEKYTGLWFMRINKNHGRFISLPFALQPDYEAKHSHGLMDKNETPCLEVYKYYQDR